MEIGPVPGIRALQVVRVPSADAKPPAIFDIDASAKPGDGGGSRSGRKAAGAEEDEEDDLTIDDNLEQGSEALEDLPPRRVNYIA
jgi:hypothetical protein